MAEQSAIASPFPAPPPFYKHFTKQNLAALRRLQKDDDAPVLPKDLQFLVPPEPPVGKYSSFGAEIDRDAPEPTLAAAGIEQVYPAAAEVRLNPQPYLIVLARSLLTTFLSLTGILSANPELYQEKTQDLQTLMYNMHDLINQYRPHQARETLILLMEERVLKMRREIEAIDEAKQKVADLLRKFQEEGPSSNSSARKPAVDQADTLPTKDARKMRQLAAFEALNTELG